jgi:hypothetical protein
LLDVAGLVAIALHDGSRGSLVADGRELVLDVDDAGALEGLAGRRTVRVLGEALEHAGLTLQVRCGSRLLLSAGRGVRPSALDRALGLRHVRAERRYAIRSAFRRRSIA